MQPQPFVIENLILDILKNDNNAYMGEIINGLIGLRQGYVFGGDKGINYNNITPSELASATLVSHAYLTKILDTKNRIVSKEFQLFTYLKTELSCLFYLSGFIYCDHFIRPLSILFDEYRKQNNKGALKDIARRILLLTLITNGTHVQLELLYEIVPDETVATLVALLSNPIIVPCNNYVNKVYALENKEMLNKIMEHTNLIKNTVNCEQFVSSYMLCSYAAAKNRHYFKSLVNQAIVKEFGDCQPSYTKPDPIEKPVIVIMLEAASPVHAMLRSYGNILFKLKEKFFIVAVSFVGCNVTTDDLKKYFDDALLINTFYNNENIISFSIKSYIQSIMKFKPHIIYYPSIGMQIFSTICSNLRLAPIQVMSYGHPAPSLSDNIDYTLIEEDYVPEKWDPLDKSKLISLPAGSFPIKPLSKYYPSTDRSTDGVVRIGVSAMAYKISNLFISALHQINISSPIPIKWYFFVNQPALMQATIKQDLVNVFRGATVYTALPHDEYTKNLGQLDIYLSPFPFNGTNSTIDAIMTYLPVVSFTGEESCEKTDSAILSRYLPKDEESILPKTVEEYVAETLKLITDLEYYNKQKDRAKAGALKIVDVAENADATQVCDALYNIYKSSYDLKETLASEDSLAAESKGEFTDTCVNTGKDET